MNEALRLELSSQQLELLEQFISHPSKYSYRFIERCKIVVLAAQGKQNAQIGRQLNITRQCARRWRKRWTLGQDKLNQSQTKDLKTLMMGLLSDQKRSGRKAKFSSQQLASILTVACELPEESNRPVTHWTPRELVDECVKRKIVDSISIRHLKRFLKKGESIPIELNIG